MSKLPLSETELMNYPVLYQTDPHEDASEKYSVIKTIDVIKELRDKYNWYPTSVQVAHTDDEKRKDKTYYIRGTFTKFNTDFAKDVIHFADEGFKLTSVEPVVSEPQHDYALTNEDMPIVFKQYEELAEEILRRNNTNKEFKFFHFMVDLNQGPCVVKRLSGCGAGSEYIAVTPEGDIYPCHQFVGDLDFKMGNVNTGEFEETLNVDFKNAHVYNKEKCKACWAKFYCSGGCHANAYNFNNDINIPYEVGCEMEKKRLECSIYIKAKEMLEV